MFSWLLPPLVGLRIGKGEGFADMEYGMMASMRAVNESTVVVTVVHDCQVSLCRWNLLNKPIVSWNSVVFLFFFLFLSSTGEIII